MSADFKNVDKSPLQAGNMKSVRLEPRGLKFINGVSSSYEDTFPKELEGIVSTEDFEAAINQINNTLTDYWPCMFCYGCGYGCCICTAGLSLLCPNLCISDAENFARDQIRRINGKRCFEDAGVTWALTKSCGKSWIEITFNPDYKLGVGSPIHAPSTSSGQTPPRMV